jgi:hypothetical protein
MPERISNRPASHKANVAKKARFLSALTKGLTVKDAAAYASISRRVAYDWRDQDAEFAKAWEEAIEESVEELEAEVRRRALDPKDTRSYLLLMFLLKKHKPEYRENYKREVTVKHETVHEIDFSQEDMDEAINILTQAKNRQDPNP